MTSQRRRWWLLAFVLSVLPGLTLVASGAPVPGQDLLGRQAEAWTTDHWLNSPPLELSDLRGQVVLVRWWTAPHCPFCAATAPALVDFHRRYREDGLQVVGLYHHKSNSPLDPAAVSRYAKAFGFTFPVAVDPQWQTLRRWWLDGGRSFTSVSFLIDRQGVIRHVHPGGQYAPGEADHREMEAWIQRLLAEDPMAGGDGSGG